MVSSVSFILALTSIACLLAMENEYAYSSSEDNKDFEINTSNVIDGHLVVSPIVAEDLRRSVMEKVSSVEDTPHGEIAAEMMDSVHLNLNHSMLNVGENKADTTKCNLFSGTWVRDASYPLFLGAQCPYVDSKATCRQNGRPDSDYEKWRWQPSGCSIPSFNARDMLERLRGKRLMFVGDSISQSQWESMVCMLQAVIPSNKKTMISQSSLTIFKALDYSASVEFFWAPFLVQLRTDSQNKRILYLDSMESNGIYWQGIDVLVFESSHWWQHQRWDLIMDGNKLYTNMDRMVAYKKALMTWTKWISANIDPKRSLVFFSTTSPKHFDPREWSETNVYHCYNQTGPVQFEGFRPPVPPQVLIVKEVVESMSFPVTLMDITGLSQFRKDGHPSIYSSVLSNEEKKHPEKFGDCSHWCLPGVPDTWNELLYASLILKGFGG